MTIIVYITYGSKYSLSLGYGSYEYKKYISIIDRLVLKDSEQCLMYNRYTNILIYCHYMKQHVYILLKIYQE